MRVLHVTESFAAGGIETTFLNMLRAWALAPAWASHDVLSFGGGPLETAYRSVADAVTVAAGPAGWERAVDSRPYDVVYFLFERCAYRVLPYVVSRTPAAVVYGKGYDMAGMARLNDGLRWQPDESMLWAADGATWTTAELKAGYRAPADGVVLGKAADIAPFLALEPPGGRTPVRIVCVANLHARKRLDDLVTATARLRSAVPSLTVRFVGADATGNERARLADYAGSLGVAHACEFVGHHANVAPDLAESRVFALPSGCEGVPTAMLEAMAAARPVVVTDVGHVRSVVRTGVDGWVVPAGDVDALTERLYHLLTAEAAARRMGLAGRERARTHDTRTVAGRLKQAIIDAVHRNAPRNGAQA